MFTKITDDDILYINSIRFGVNKHGVTQTKMLRKLKL